MCIPIRQLDAKARRMRAIANASLLLGLIPWIFREQIRVPPDWLHAFCGFFLGLSITIHLHMLWCARRCREKQV